MNWFLESISGVCRQSDFRLCFNHWHKSWMFQPKLSQGHAYGFLCVWNEINSNHKMKLEISYSAESRENSVDNFSSDKHAGKKRFWKKKRFQRYGKKLLPVDVWSTKHEWVWYSALVFTFLQWKLRRKVPSLRAITPTIW